jgi:hypothetical protein
MALGDFDTVLKRLFKIRGEAPRIDEGKKQGRPLYRNLNLGTEFDEAIAAMRHCRLIRNQYAHCNWWDDYSGHLAFANLEDAARITTVVPDLLDLLPKPCRSPAFAIAGDIFQIHGRAAGLRQLRRPNASRKTVRPVSEAIAGLTPSASPSLMQHYVHFKPNTFAKMPKNTSESNFVWTSHLSVFLKIPASLFRS